MAYTTIDDPSEYFQTKLYAGTGNELVITNDGNSDLQPDFIWIKNRTDGDTNHHGHYTNVPTTRVLFINKTDYEDGPIAQSVKSIQSDGFTLGTWDGNNINAKNFVAWQWKCNSGTTASNSSGDITSTVQVNQDAGFSIGNYTGNGSTGDQTVGHGLGERPSCVIVKNRDNGSANWVVYIDGLDVNHSLELNTSDGQSDSTAGRVLATPAGSYGTSSIFTLRVGGSSVVQTNTNNQNYVFFAWAQKQGYSKFGKYVGNGNADGPFVYTGFKPAFLIMKEYSSAGGNWVMFDTTRDPSNVTKHRLFPNLTNATNTTRDYIDLLSNGFKMRNTDADHNQSGQSMVYMAFAENPFVTSTGIPTTAR